MFTDIFYVTRNQDILGKYRKPCVFYTIVFVHLILSFNFFRYIFERHHYIAHIGTDVGSKIKRTTNEFCSNIEYVHGVSLLFSRWKGRDKS